MRSAQVQVAEAKSIVFVAQLVSSSFAIVTITIIILISMRITVIMPFQYQLDHHSRYHCICCNCN